VTLAAEIRAALHAVADPARAPGMQAYMKSAMPYLGVPVPLVRRTTQARTRGLDAAAALGLATELWDAATHREEWYAALAVLALPSLAGDHAAVPLIERFVVEGRWWDVTDELAHRMAALHDAQPAATRALVLGWSLDRRSTPASDAGMWLRRLAILSQLGRRDRIDLGLLAAVIEPNAADPAFFVRKAIGWALREAARVDPDWVRDFVADRELSPLSRREALKHLGSGTQELAPDSPETRRSTRNEAVPG